MAKFLCNTDWWKAIESLDEGIQMEVLGAMFRYAGILYDNIERPEKHRLSQQQIDELTSDEQLGLKRISRVAFGFIKSEINYNVSKRLEQKQVRAEAGRKGGLSKRNNAAKAEERNDDLLSKANSEPSNSDDSDMQQQYSKAGQSIKMPRKPQLYPDSQAMLSKAKQTKQCLANEAMLSNESIYVYGNDNNIDNINNTQCAHTHVREGGFDDSVIYNEMRTNHTWLEALSVKFGLAPNVIIEWINDFQSECTLRANSHSSRQDAYSHFVSWLPIRLRIENENQHETSKASNHRMPPAGNAAAARQQREAETIGTINRLLASAHAADGTPAE